MSQPTPLVSLSVPSCSLADNKGFSWHAKNGEKWKASEEIVSKSCWVCAISRPFPGVWTSDIVQTGCVTGLSPPPPPPPASFFRMSCVHICWPKRCPPYQNGQRREWVPASFLSYIVSCSTRHWHDIFRGFLCFPFFACQGKSLLSG